MNPTNFPIQVDLQLATDDPNIPNLSEFQAWITMTLEHPHLNPPPQVGGEGEREQNLEVCIRIVNPAESQQLNGQYRGKEKPTNVLSFDYEDDNFDEEIRLIGDLAICASIVEQEAKEQDKALKAHWAHMTVHGILHLVGYDHQTEAEANDMEALEINIMKQLGFDNPYE